MLKVIYRWSSIRRTPFQEYSRSKAFLWDQDSYFILKISLKVPDWNLNDILSAILCSSEGRRLDSILKRFYSNNVMRFECLSAQIYFRRKTDDREYYKSTTHQGEYHTCISFFSNLTNNHKMIFKQYKTYFSSRLQLRKCQLV